MRARYCVISPTVSADGVPRTWLEAQIDAEAHATNLLISKYHRPGTELYVVKVVAKVRVEKPLPPPITIEVIE